MQEARIFRLLLTDEGDHLDLSVVPVSGLRPIGVQPYHDFDAVIERLRELRLPAMVPARIHEIRVYLSVRKRCLLYGGGLRLSPVELRRLLSA